MRWKLIKGWPYEVSDCGHIRSLHTGKLKAIRLDSDGYCIVDLYNDGKVQTLKVHRLVAQAFIPNPRRKPQINHKDFVRSNNVVANLKWATSKENINYSADAGRMWEGPQCRPIVARLGGSEVRFFSIRAAERAGYHRNSIYLCLQGKQAHHRKRTWGYA
jgi:hypothetical protein